MADTADYATRRRVLKRIRSVLESQYAIRTEGQDAITDIITDTMHYCASRGLDWTLSLERAERHLRDEGGVHAEKPKTREHLS